MSDSRTHYDGCENDHEHAAPALDVVMPQVMVGLGGMQTVGVEVTIRRGERSITATVLACEEQPDGSLRIRLQPDEPIPELYWDVR